jgi:hypothetical protein
MTKSWMAARSGWGSSISHRALIIAAIVAVAGTFVFRFLTVEFTNDHFVHLSRGAQILYGDVPIRDFFDPGLTLQYYASAAALWWSGHNLFGETILTVGFIAAAAGLTFVAAARLSGSIWLAAAATAAAVLSMPRLYNYPKVFFYVAAIVVAWRYASRPGRAGLIALAVVTVVAFFFRHDHGVYIGLANVALLVILHWPQPKQVATALTQYGGITLLLLLPFFIFVQSTVGLFRYASNVAAPPFQILWMPVSIDLSAPLFALSPPTGPRVNVRWHDHVDAGARQQLELRHELLSPEHVDGSTWSYVPMYLDREHIGALVDDPAVADTHGIDRPGHVLETEPAWYLKLQRQIPAVRVRIAPGVFSRGNADAWFYYVTFLLPPVGLALVAVLLWQGLISRPEAAVVGMSCVLCLIIVQTLVRGSPDSRLPDVASPISVIAAWVSAKCFGLSDGAGRITRRMSVAVVAAAVIVTLWSVGTFAQVSTTLETSQVLSGPVGVWHRMSTVTERLRMRPIDNWTRQSSGIGAIMRYVFECTAETDRLIAAWFAPEIYFYVARGFAGGQVYLIQRWHNSPEDQRLTIARLDRQRVPIVIEKIDYEYHHYFPLVADYIHERYREVPIQGDIVQGFRVLVDSRLTATGTYEPLGAPCYRQSPDANRDRGSAGAVPRNGNNGRG